MQPDRRKHQRLAIKMPVECRFPGTHPLRASTRNISTGGLLFELDLPTGAPQPASRAIFEVVVTVPPGLGHSPYQGHVSAPAEIVRCDLLEHTNLDGQRYGVAARFKQPLQLKF